MSSRALTLALRLLTTACAGAALGPVPGCLPFGCGEPWSEVTAVELGTDADILALSGGNGFEERVAVGRGGVVVHFDDAASISHPTDVDLFGVVAGDGPTLVVGENGTIRRTGDRGLTWTAPESGITDDLLAIVYSHTPEYYVAIAAEQVLYSFDGGVTWAIADPPALGWGGLRTGFFSGSRVFVVGTNGTAWSTADPSAGWTAESLGTTDEVLGGGRVSGDESSSYASTIAVATATEVWLREPDATQWSVSPSSFDAEIVAFAGGFAVTQNGTIYDIDERGYAEQIANVGLAPLAISGGWGGFMVAGEGGNAARAYFQECVGGRPWTIDGEQRTAKLVRGSAWVADHGLDSNRTRHADDELLAAAWARDGQFEHASIASFARATVELMRFGAPAELITANRQAMLDEIEHARRCFALASRYAGHALGPGPLPLGSGRSVTPAELAVAVFEDGCVNESVAAAEAAVAASECTDPAVRETLERIGADEREHAALAWRTLRWLLDSFGHEVAPAVRRQLVSLGAPLAGQKASGSQPACLREHGRLPTEERATIHRRVFAELIVPLSRELLSGSARAQA